jgi:hypothetical protein
MDDTGFDVAAVDVDAIPWDDVAPDGTRYAVLAGRRDVPGAAFVYAFAIPAGFWDPPHVHSADARVTVVRGALHLGLGTRMDTNAARVLGTGGSLVVPGGAAHFDGSVEETVIVGTAVGPWWTRYVDEDGVEIAGA